MIHSGLPSNIADKIELLDCGFDTECWQWTGAIQTRGYGSVSIGNKRTGLVHRVVYQLLAGPIPRGLQIDHLCRNTRCCNPGHLEPVTGKVNSERSVKATKTHCAHGHPLCGANLIQKKSHSNPDLTIRNCRICSIERNRKYRKQNGAKRCHAVAHRDRAILIAAAEALTSGAAS